jgi:hypothetical protein
VLSADWQADDGQAGSILKMGLFARHYFRLADDPGVGQSTQYKRVCQDLTVLQEFQ